MSTNINSGIPLIGAPKLSDAPALPDDVLKAYLQPIEEGISHGASFSQPVTLELLVLGTALRDLRDLRAAVAGLDSVYSEDAQALLPKVKQEQP
jgi:hypothetical protein|tara:strand:+ start:2102 stop:2383 length:282 start_codon:yes stop_codon:yes gene_type:complete